MLDARELVVLIDEVDTASDICNLCTSFGAPCQACPSDGQEICLAVMIDQLVGEERSDTALETVPASGHGDCDGQTSCGGCAARGRSGPSSFLALLGGLGSLLARRRRARVASLAG